MYIVCSVCVADQNSGHIEHTFHQLYCKTVVIDIELKYFLEYSTTIVQRASDVLIHKASSSM